MADKGLSPGRVVGGRYRLEVRLGTGGMSAVWRAKDQVLSAPVAIKLLDPAIVGSAEAEIRFEREAKAAAALRSLHVVQTLDYGVDAGQPYIVMELLEGENLRQRLKRCRRLKLDELAQIVTHVGRAIGRAHDAGIIHRDLKPDNIFLVNNDDVQVAKVFDFGIAKVKSGGLKLGGTETRTGLLLGTPQYMSPEQALGTKQVDHRTDLWSLGVIAYECLVGKRPFTSDALGDLVVAICVRPIPVPSEQAAVPAGFDEWCARALARDPDLRFQSAREMVDGLRECLGDHYQLTVAGASDGELRDSPPRANPEPTFLSPPAAPIARKPGSAPVDVAQRALDPVVSEPTVVGSPVSKATSEEQTEAKPPEPLARLLPEEGNPSSGSESELADFDTASLGGQPLASTTVAVHAARSPLVVASTMLLLGLAGGSLLWTVVERQSAANASPASAPSRAGPILHQRPGAGVALPDRAVAPPAASSATGSAGQGAQAEQDATDLAVGAPSASAAAGVQADAGRPKRKRRREDWEVRRRRLLEPADPNWPGIREDAEQPPEAEPEPAEPPVAEPPAQPMPTDKPPTDNPYH